MLVESLPSTVELLAVASLSPFDVAPELPPPPELAAWLVADEVLVAPPPVVGSGSSNSVVSSAEHDDSANAGTRSKMATPWASDERGGISGPTQGRLAKARSQIFAMVAR